MKVIKGKMRAPESKALYYLNALQRFTEKNAYVSFDELADKDNLVKYVYLGIKWFSYVAEMETKAYTREHVEEEHRLIESILDAIGLITPAQLTQMFPPEKRFDGKKRAYKDYFSTMEALNKLEPDKPIGDDRTVFDTLWDYQNWDVNLFMVACMANLNRIRQLNGEPDLMDELFQEQRVDSYTLHETEGYLQNNRTGEVFKLPKPKKRIPRNLKVHR